MSRKVEKKLAQGTYGAEFVKEIKPLGEDRQTQFIPDAPPDKIASLGGRTLKIFLSSIMNALSERFGDEVWEVAKRAMYEVGRQRAPTMVRLMKIHDLKDARCLGRIMDLEDNLDRVQKRAEQYEQVDQNCAKSPALAVMEEFAFGDIRIITALSSLPGVALTGETCGAQSL